MDVEKVVGKKQTYTRKVEMLCKKSSIKQILAKKIR